MKISFPMASAVTVLAWGYHTWEETYIVNDLSEKMKEVLRWPLDYLKKTFNKDNEILYTMVRVRITHIIMHY